MFFERKFSRFYLGNFAGIVFWVQNPKIVFLVENFMFDGS